VESGGGVNGHAADGIDRFGNGFIHGFVSFFVAMVFGNYLSRCSIYGDDWCAGLGHTTFVAIPRRVVLIFFCSDTVIFVASLQMMTGKWYRRHGVLPPYECQWSAWCRRGSFHRVRPGERWLG
jgi:hypothetical protein